MKRPQLDRRTKEPPATANNQAGEATVEFVAYVLIVVLPALYLILTVLTLVAASFATHAGVASATRILIAHPDATASARYSVQLALQDQHLQGNTVTTFKCEPECRSGNKITVTVTHKQPLPGLPTWLTRGLHLEIPITARQTGIIYGDAT